MFYKNLYEELLIEYADACVRMQDRSGDKAFDGGIKCESCKNIHGRCIDAVFGLTVAYKLTKESKYLDCLKRLFDYGENLMCLDGGIYNDAQTEWRYTTTFQEIALIETMLEGKDVLDKETVTKFEERIKKCAKWLFENLNEFSYANINYATTNGLALSLAGEYLHNEDYLKQGKHLIEYASEHFTDDHILYGETKPHNARSKKGCCAVDIGYNMEESVPALIKFAFHFNDEKLIKKLEFVARKNLEFVLPDGGIDNTFGDRNNKWTYWGSRTSDGVHAGFLHYAHIDTAFAEASLRNLEQLRKCTKDGILYGGPDYEKHGEYGCTHHMFEHINSLAYSITHFDAKYLDRKLFGSTELPLDKEFNDHINDLRVIRAKRGEYFMSVSDYDFLPHENGHAEGLTLTCLFKGKDTPIIMGSVTDYELVEPTNMQLVKDREHHRSLLPRLQIIKDEKKYTSTYFDNSEYKYDFSDVVTIEGTTGLENKQKDILRNSINVNYQLSKTGLKVKYSNLSDEILILPLINGNLEIKKGSKIGEEKIFFLTGGFIANEIQIKPENGEIEFEIK